MTKTHQGNLPRPNKQRLNRFKTKLRKIAAGTDDRMSPEEMTSLLPLVGADLQTKAYLANPERFIASIDTSVLPFLPQVVVTHIRGRVFELHTMPADTGDIFAAPARSMSEDQLRVAMRLLLERCQILNAAYKQMRNKTEHFHDWGVQKAKELQEARDLVSIDPQNMNKRRLLTLTRQLSERCQELHAACEQMKGNADGSFQSIEEKRHAGSASLTAVRLWPYVSCLLADNSKQARARFIGIFTAYKVLAAKEYSVLGQAQAITLDRLSALLKKSERQRALRLLSELDSNGHAGRIALVRLHVYMRRRGDPAEHALEALRDVLAKTKLNDADRETIVRASASASLIASHTRNNRREAQGNPAKYARLRLFKSLSMFWSRYGRAPLRDASVNFTTEYIDFLEHLSERLASEIKAREISGHDRLRLGNRKAITAALSSLKTKKNNTLVRRPRRHPISGRGTRSHPG